MKWLQAQTQNPEKRLPTHSEMEDALNRLFHVHKEDLKYYYDDPPQTWQQWLQLSDPDDIGMLLSNEMNLYNRYFNLLPQDVSVYDVVGLFLKGELPQTPVPQYQYEQQTIETTDVGDRNLPWQSKQTTIDPEHFRQMYLIAKQRVNPQNREAVQKARKEVYLAFNSDKALAEEVGLSARELNDWVRNHAGLTVERRNLESRLNANIPNEHQWVGISNCSWLNRQVITPEELDAFVGDINVTQDGQTEWHKNRGAVLRRMIMNTFLAVDTRIDYHDLNFVIDDCGPRANGTYYHTTKTVTVDRLSQHTIAHEIGHYLDHKWGDQYAPFVGSYLSDANYVRKNVPPQHEHWIRKFKEFVRNLEDKSDISSEYHQTRSEVFARFIDQFQDWTMPDKERWPYNYAQDKFDESDFRVFIKLLQEKSYIDAKFPLGR